MLSEGTLWGEELALRPFEGTQVSPSVKEAHHIGFRPYTTTRQTASTVQLVKSSRTQYDHRPPTIPNGSIRNHL